MTVRDKTDTVDHVVVPGTFDPLTYGHLDVILRARRLFPQVTIAVAASFGKNGTGPTFSLDERVQMIEETLAEVGATDGIEVRPCTGLLMNFCREVGAGSVVKGLRSMTDFEYELQQAGVNAHLAKDVETVFIVSNVAYSYVSSSVVRELVSLGANVSTFVPQTVLRHLEARFGAAQ